MKTPIYDFVTKYAASDVVRMHMPGHKGASDAERLDITEVYGADSLYEADGIILESEKCASCLFGAPTYYTTEGSSHAIRTMLYLAYLYAREQGKSTTVLAARNAHKVLVSASMQIGFDIEWMYSENGGYMSCVVSKEALAARLDAMASLPMAVYITSPDYLGNTSDIAALSKVCSARGVLLLVDNAHGAYLRFLSPSRHPLDLGADMCASSAHKTLPVLTGGAYLHIKEGLLASLPADIKAAMAQFGSTSPSYLTLVSLDKANAYLEEDFARELNVLVAELDRVKAELTRHGYTLIGDEEMKITIAAKTYGYLGTELAQILRAGGVEVEFSDPDYVVLMPSPVSLPSLDRVLSLLISIPRKDAKLDTPPTLCVPEAAVSPREAMLMPSESVSVSGSLGRVLAAVTVGCPPAVPILVSGEVVDKDAIAAFEYYGIEHIRVLKRRTQQE